MGTISTAGAYGMAKLGIYAAQKAMEVTGNNITNINTEGYTRQRLDQKSLYMAGADRYSSKWEARVGGGVITTGVSQLRDPYLDIRFRTENSSVGAYETRLKGLQQLASVLDEVGKGEDDEGVFEAQFNDLIAQITDMAASGAGKDAYDTLVQGSAKSLVSLFNTYADKLETIRKNTELSFKEDVQTVNTILKKIQTLNDSIRKSDIHGGPGLELRDERNLLLDELSEYVAINVRYEEEKIGAGMTVEKLIVELDSHERKDTNGKSLGHDKQELVNGIYVTQFEPHMVNSDPDDTNSPLVFGPNYDMHMTELKNIHGETYEYIVKDNNGNPVMIPKTDANGNVILDKDNKPVSSGKYQTTPSEAVWLTDNDLYGRLQSNRELLTEKGEFATLNDLNGQPLQVDKDGKLLSAYVQAGDGKGDINANTKRGIPYYQKALDLMARKFADTLNQANTLPDTALYNFATTTVNKTNNLGLPIDAAGNVLVQSGYVRAGSGEFALPADKDGNTLILDPNDPTSGKYVRLDNPKIYAEPAKDADGDVIDADGRKLESDAGVNKGKYFRANDLAFESTPAKTEVPVDFDGCELVFNSDKNKYFIKGKDQEACPAFVDKDGNPVFVKVDAAGNPVLDKNGKEQAMSLTEMKDAGYIDDNGNLIREYTDDKGDKHGIPEAIYDKLVKNPNYSHYNGGPLFSNNGNGNDTEGITAMNISISNAWATGATHVLQTKQPIDPDRPQSTQQDNIQHILSIIADNDLKYKPSDLYPTKDTPDASASWDTVFFSGSYQDFLTDMCETLADDSRVSTSRVNNYISALNDLYSDRDSVSGVDLNDEAINMMQYNKAYSASCRLLTTLDEMIDKLVNGTAI